MAATSKPLRKEIKKNAKLHREYVKTGGGHKEERKYLVKDFPKIAKINAKEEKAQHHKKKGEMKKYTKAKLAAAHAHMKAFGG